MSLMYKTPKGSAKKYKIYITDIGKLYKVDNYSISKVSSRNPQLSIESFTVIPGIYTEAIKYLKVNTLIIDNVEFIKVPKLIHYRLIVKDSSIKKVKSAACVIKFKKQNPECIIYDNNICIIVVHTLEDNKLPVPSLINICSRNIKYSLYSKENVCSICNEYKICDKYMMHNLIRIYYCIDCYINDQMPKFNVEKLENRFKLTKSN
jgi:hypothetical protein